MPELAEAKYSAKQLQQMMAKGQAMRNEKGDPSYPIADKDDLGNAIQAVGRGSTPSGQVKAYIVKRAKALGAEDTLPDDWKSGSGKKPPFVKAKESADLDTEDEITESAGAEDDLDDGAEAEVEEAASDQSELVELVEAERSGTGRRRKIKLIQSGWSRNGRYYGADVLAEAARTKVFPTGTPMYVNHPTATEKEERPERSIEDLAARLDTDAWFESGALFAEATHFGLWQPILNGPDGLAEHVDISVRCLGEASQGFAEGREGLIVSRIVEGRSVDYVTEGAAGGKVLELLEAAGREELEEGRNVGAWLEAQMHSEFTVMADRMYGEGRLNREERVSLSSALGDALQSFVRRVESDQPQLYKRDLYVGPEAQNLSEGQQAASAEEKGTEMEESQSTVPTPGTTRALVARELSEARRERDLAIARERARELIPVGMAEAWIPPTTQLRITESIMSSLPVKDGKLDEVELAKRISREVEVGEREMAEALEAAGVGSPRDLGVSSQAGNMPFGVDRGELNDRLSKAFGELGMSESVTKRAVQGRG